MTTLIPSWLESPPEHNEIPPPLATRDQGLPFSQLLWSDFERLILRIVRQDQTIEDCTLYGTQGQKQFGIDILATTTTTADKRTCYQCKNVEQFGPSDIKEAIDTFLGGKWASRTSEYILCVAIPLVSTKQVDAIDEQRDRLRQQGIQLSVWDAAPAGILSERLKKAPWLVDDFFGRAWVRAFNGDEAAAELGERLDGFAMAGLRRRLTTLYSTLFAQHDPGIRLDRPVQFQYLDRYVPADVTERTSIADAPSGLPDLTVPQGDSETPTASANLSRVDTYDIRRPILDWVQDYDQCVVLGEPGHGKSAILRFLSLYLLRAHELPEQGFHGRHLSRLPVWISFGRFCTAIERRADLSVEDFFRDWLHQHSFEDITPLFLRALRRSEVLLLVDGLDEFSSDLHAREALARIVAFVRSRTAALICTSRPRGFRALGVPSSWPTATLLPLTDRQIQLLANHWFVVSEVLAVASGETAHTLRSLADPRATAFLAAIKSNDRTHDLARNPLLCQALIELFRYSHRLPEGRVVAYEQIVELLLLRHPDARAQAAFLAQPIAKLGLRSADLKEMLLRIAAQMQGSSQRGILTTQRCNEICASYLEDETAGLGLSTSNARRQSQAIVNELITQFGILVERAPNEIGFLHLSLQEFLTAEWIAQKGEAEQLDWVSRIWLEPSWREALISWFGILGSRGRKPLAGKALQLLAERGTQGAWERMQSLDLRTELVCSDLGLPIGEARKTISEAAANVELSPFVEHRVNLARSLTVGALGLPVRTECLPIVARWLPSRPDFARSALLRTFATWQPADDLKDALCRAIFDESRSCRVAAVDSFVEVFGSAQDSGDRLSEIATRNLSANARATALRGLTQRSEWTELAALAANANLISANVDLLLEAIRVRVLAKVHDDSDLQCMWRIFANDGIRYELRDPFTDVLYDGWREDVRLRGRFIEIVADEQSRLDHDVPLGHLVRSYPGDKEVGDLIVHLIDRHGSHFAGMGTTARLWEFLVGSFRGNADVSAALRRMLKKQKEQYKAIFWHPNTTPAFVVIGDDAARDELISSYEEADQRGRYWIGKTLLDGWATDSAVHVAVKTWARADPKLAGPLTTWAPILFPEKNDRQTWLKHLVKTADTELVVDSIKALLREFPDDDARIASEARLHDEKLWYYHAISIRGWLARYFPTSQIASTTVHDAFAELDGPRLADFAVAYEHDSAIRGRLLAAATSAPTDVRSAFTSVLQERATDMAIVDAMTRDVLAEENSAIRTGALTARVRVTKQSGGSLVPLERTLLDELTSTGSFMGSRRRSALAALIELGDYEQIASTLAKETTRDWHYDIVGRLEADPISIGTLVRHWDDLAPPLRMHGLKSELPIDEIVSAGYAGLLEQTETARRALDARLLSPPQWFDSNYLEVLARRYPGRKELARVLIELIVNEPGRMIQCTAARLLAEHFASDTHVALQLKDVGTDVEGSKPYRAAPGVLGHLARGFPGTEFDRAGRTLLRTHTPNDFPRDFLLLSTTRQDADLAEQSAKVLLSDPLRDWRYQLEDLHALLVWSRDAISKSALALWLCSQNATHAITAISLLGQEAPNRLDANALRRRLNEAFANVKWVPTDGLDAVKGRTIGWAQTVYTAIAALSRQ